LDIFPEAEMWVFNSILGNIFTFFIYPFKEMNPWIGLTYISFLTAVFMLFVFRIFSNQKGIKQIKNKIKAHLLEIRLYKDSLSQTLKAQTSILKYNLKYMSYSIKPMLIMIIPLVIILIQLNLWFNSLPLAPEERTLLKVKLDNEVDLLTTSFSIEETPAIKVETSPLRIEETNEVNWRIRALENGSHKIKLRIGGDSLLKEIRIGESSLGRISKIKIRKNLLNELLNPGEPPLPGDIPVKSIEINYPSRFPEIAGIPLWLLAYFALSIIFAFLLKAPLKVEI